jgi:hypothetical protein
MSLRTRAFGYAVLALVLLTINQPASAQSSDTITIFSGTAVLHESGGHELGDSIEVAGCTLSFVYQRAEIRAWLKKASGKKLTLEFRPGTYRPAPNEVIMLGNYWHNYDLDSQKNEMLFMFATWQEETPSPNMVILTTYDSGVHQRFLQVHSMYLNPVFRIE